MARDFVDPYLYPNTNVLGNKPGLQTEAALRSFEYERTAIRLAQLQQNPIKGKFDLDHLKRIHAHVFQDVYQWAGQTRVINISKGGTTFDPPGVFEKKGQVLAESFARDNYLKGREKQEVVDGLARYYSAWNSLHPFREGNGRSTRELVGQMAHEAGYTLDQTRIDNQKQQWNNAARDSFNGDLRGVKEIFSQALRPSRSLAFEQLPQEAALARHPELKGAYQSLAVMRDRLEQTFAGNEQAQGHFLKHAKSEMIRRLDAGKLVPELAPQIAAVLEAKQQQQQSAVMAAGSNKAQVPTTGASSSVNGSPYAAGKTAVEGSTTTAAAAAAAVQPPRRAVVVSASATTAAVPKTAAAATTTSSRSR